jgi:hypothetical protein
MELSTTGELTHKWECGNQRHDQLTFFMELSTTAELTHKWECGNLRHDQLTNLLYGAEHYWRGH